MVDKNLVPIDLEGLRYMQIAAMHKANFRGYGRLSQADLMQRTKIGGRPCPATHTAGPVHLWLISGSRRAIRGCRRRPGFVLLWSTGFIVAKYAAPHAPPLTFLLYDSPGVVLILLPLVVATQGAMASHRRSVVRCQSWVSCCRPTYLGGCLDARSHWECRPGCLRCWSAPTAVDGLAGLHGQGAGVAAAMDRFDGGFAASRWCCRTV